MLAFFNPEVRLLQPVAHNSINIRDRIYKPLFTKSLLVTAGLLISFLLGAPLAQSALVAAALLLVTRRLKPERILQEVDWNLLLMFSGLFILAHGTQTLNLLQPFTA